LKQLHLFIFDPYNKIRIRGHEGKRNKGTKEQRNKRTKEQRNKGTKGQKNKRTKKKKPPQIGVDGIEPSLAVSKTDALPLGDTPCKMGGNKKTKKQRGFPEESPKETQRKVRRKERTKEARGGVEPPSKDLQSPTLPLCYQAI
jgi:hypothetical protein